MEPQAPAPRTDEASRILSRHVDPDGASGRLAEVERLRREMEENFHLYKEVQALTASDRDALFRILLAAQDGDTDALEAIYHLMYDEAPVPMEEFLFGRRFLNMKGLINREKVEILAHFAQPHVRKAYLAVGSGGGKSFIVSIAKAYAIYKLMCLRRPDLFYMLGPGSKIAVINLSVSKEQARDVVFAEFAARVEACSWFSGRYKAWTRKAKFEKNIYAFAGGSTAISYYGYHTFMGSVDEACFMLDGERDMAEDLIEALTKSLMTRFPMAYKLLVISTLRAPSDILSLKIQEMREEGVRVVNRPAF